MKLLNCIMSLGLFLGLGTSASAVEMQHCTWECNISVSSVNEGCRANITSYSLDATLPLKTDSGRIRVPDALGGCKNKLQNLLFTRDSWFFSLVSIKAGYANQCPAGGGSWRPVHYHSLAASGHCETLK